MNAAVAQLRRFFKWPADKRGYKSRLQYQDANYLNLSNQDTRVAQTIERIRHDISSIPGATEIERRSTALIAFRLQTGARDSAIASMKLKHIDLAAGVRQQVPQPPCRRQS